MKILIATDCSDYSKAAIDEFCRLFIGKKDLEIKIVSAYEIVVPTDVYAGAVQYSQEVEESIKHQSEDCVSQAVELIKERFGENELNISTEVLCGIPEREIIAAAKDWHADLIIVGSHGRGFWGRLTPGSVSDTILHHASCSVLIVRVKKLAEQYGFT